MSRGRGRFLLLGSGEFEPWAGPAERLALGPASGDGSVAILATASGREGQAVHDRWLAKGLAHFASLGIPSVAVPVRTRTEALDPAGADRLDAVSMVFFSGGSPGYLAATLTETPIWEAVERLLARGGVFAGCSAGAMIAGARITPAGNSPLPFPFGSGMGLLPTTVVGVHWDAMSAWWIRWLRDLGPRRLAPGLQFLGIAENTAIASDGDRWSVFGAGDVEVRAGNQALTFRAGESFVV